MMTEDVSPDKEVMIALGPETLGVRNRVKKTSVRDAMAAAGIQAFFESNADRIDSHGIESFLRILSMTRSSTEMSREFRC